MCNYISVKDDRNTKELKMNGQNFTKTKQEKITQQIADLITQSQEVTNFLRYMTNRDNAEALERCEKIAKQMEELLNRATLLLPEFVLKDDTRRITPYELNYCYHSGKRAYLAGDWEWYITDIFSIDVVDILPQKAFNPLDVDHWEIFAKKYVELSEEIYLAKYCFNLMNEKDPEVTKIRDQFVKIVSEKIKGVEPTESHFCNNFYSNECDIRDITDEEQEKKSTEQLTTEGIVKLFQDNQDFFTNKTKGIRDRFLQSMSTINKDILKSIPLNSVITTNVYNMEKIEELKVVRREKRGYQNAGCATLFYSNVTSIFYPLCLELCDILNKYAIQPHIQSKNELIDFLTDLQTAMTTFNTLKVLTKYKDKRITLPSATETMNIKKVA